MDTGFNTDISTTNRQHYRSESFLPPIKFYQIPSIQLKDAPKLPPRKFPIEPLGPKRHWEKFDHNILPNIQPFTDKPIVRAPPPNKVVIKPKSAKGKRRDKAKGAGLAVAAANEALPPVIGPFRPDEQGYYTEEVPRDILNELCHSLRWNTSTGKATKEACLPTPQVIHPDTTLEENADVVMHRPKRFESRPEPGQRVAAVWDRLQIRPHVGEIVGRVGARQQELKYEKSNKPPGYIVRRQLSVCGQKKPGMDLLTPAANETIVKLCHTRKLSSTYVRQCPGYAGYVPRSPLVIPMEGYDVPNLRMMTTMQASYRPIPLNGTLKHVHKGPLSNTVTLTFPYNPYNKVENRAFFRKDIEHPW